jgi:hypothetical protein
LISFESHCGLSCCVMSHLLAHSKLLYLKILFWLIFIRVLANWPIKKKSIFLWLFSLHFNSLVFDILNWHQLDIFPFFSQFNSIFYHNFQLNSKVSFIIKHSIYLSCFIFDSFFSNICSSCMLIYWEVNLRPYYRNLDLPIHFY